MGECTLVPPVLAAVREEHPGVGLIWIDAHGDLNTPATSPSGFLGGMPFAELLGWCFDDWRLAAGLDPPLREERAVLVDGRDLDPGERELFDASRVHEAADASAPSPRCRPAPRSTSTSTRTCSTLADARCGLSGARRLEHRADARASLRRWPPPTAWSRSRSARAPRPRSTPRASCRSSTRCARCARAGACRRRRRSVPRASRARRPARA